MAILGYKNRSITIRKFGFVEFLKTHGLAGWLEIATDGIEASAKQRIASEIESHYAEAVNSHIAEGESQESARSIALAELGDPHKAAVNFRKSHLTERETFYLNQLEWIAAKPFLSFWALLLDGIPFALTTVFFFLTNGDSHSTLGLRFLPSLLLLAYSGYRLMPRMLYTKEQSRSLFLRRVALCAFTTQMIVGPTIILIGPLTHDSEPFCFIDAPLFMYIYGYALNPYFRIWRKLRKINDPRTELPSSKTTAS